MASARPQVRGKFIFVGDEKLYVRGVTYGTFRPNDEGEEFPAPEVVERDFEQMAANGVNYTGLSGILKNYYTSSGGGQVLINKTAPVVDLVGTIDTTAREKQWISS